MKRLVNTAVIILTLSAEVVLNAQSAVYPPMPNAGDPNAPRCNSVSDGTGATAMIVQVLQALGIAF